MKKKKYSIKQRFGIFLVIFFGLICLGAIYWFGVSSKTESTTENDPARGFAKIMLPFAQKNGLKKISEQSYPKGLDNNVASFSYDFQTPYPQDEMKKLMKDLLEKEGYQITEKLVENTDCEAVGCLNGGWKYWILEGKNEISDEVSVTILNQDLQIHFTSHQ